MTAPNAEQSTFGGLATGGAYAAGVHMLHILAPEVLASGPNHHELPPKALRWITQEIAIHQAANNKTLTLRYLRLVEYFAASGFGAATPSQPAFLTAPILVSMIASGVLIALAGFVYSGNPATLPHLTGLVVTVLGLAFAVGVGLVALRHSKSRNR